MKHIKSAGNLLRMFARRDPLRPGWPSLRSGHMYSRSGVKRKMKSVGWRQSNWNSTTGPVRPAGARRSVGRKHDLAHGEPDMRISDDGSVRPDFDLGRLLVYVDGDRVALDVGFDGEVARES